MWKGDLLTKLNVRNKNKTVLITWLLACLLAGMIRTYPRTIHIINKKSIVLKIIIIITNYVINGVVGLASCSITKKKKKNSGKFIL